MSTVTATQKSDEQQATNGVKTGEHNVIGCAAALIAAAGTSPLLSKKKSDNSA